MALAVDGARARAVLVVALIAATACGTASAPRSQSPPAVRAIDAGPIAPDAAAAAVRCAGAADDAHRRHADAQPAERSAPLDPLDLDGDGIADAVFRAACGGFSGNCTFVIYRCTAGGSSFLGEVEGFGFSGPFCVEPPAHGTPCRLSINRRMMHDDLQEELYDVVDGQYTRTGTGRYIAPRGRP